MIGERIPHCPWAEPVARLRCLRGMARSRRSGCAPRWATSPASRPREADALLGLVPSETARAKRDGKARSPRPLPAAPAGSSSKRPGPTAPRPAEATLQRRQQDQAAQTIAISWRARRRLRRVWHRLDAQRGKRKTLVAVAVARHLAGFCWAIANSDPKA